MSWLALTEAHLLTRLSAKELEKLRLAASAGEDDPVQAVFDSVTGKIRAHIPAGWPRGTAGTIPSEMMSYALALVVVEIMTRPGGTMIDPESQRAKDAATAESKLLDLAAGKIQLVAPEDEADEDLSGPGGGTWGSNTKINMRTNPNS